MEKKMETTIMGYLGLYWVYKGTMEKSGSYYTGL